MEIHKKKSTSAITVLKNCHDQIDVGNLVMNFLKQRGKLYAIP
jgi:hypothetical protein